MSSYPIINQHWFPSESVWLVWFLALVALLLFLRYVLARNGKVRLEVNGKELVELETAGLLANKNTKDHIKEEEKKQEKKPTENTIRKEEPNPPDL